VALIGCAFMGKAHSNAWRSVKLFWDDCPFEPVMKVVCDVDEAALKHGEQYGWEETSTDWQATVTRDDIDIVDICTPNYLHHEPAIAAAQAGKHVMCEKPLAHELEPAQRMVEAVEQAGVRNMTCFNYRRVPAVALAKKLIDEGAIGEIYHFRAVYLQDWIVDPNFPLVWRLQKEYAGSGALGDLGAHIIDLAHYLVGKITRVTGSARTFIKERPTLAATTGGLGAAAGEEKGEVTVDDAVGFIAEFEGGALGCFETSRFCPGRLNYNSFEINGSEGSIAFNLERLNELEFFSRKDPEYARGFKTIYLTDPSQPYMKAYWPGGHIIGWEHTFINEVYDFLNAIKEERDVEPTFRTGLQCQKVLDAVLRSCESGTWESVD